MSISKHSLGRRERAEQIISELGYNKLSLLELAVRADMMPSELAKFLGEKVRSGIVEKIVVSVNVCGFRTCRSYYRKREVSENE